MTRTFTDKRQLRAARCVLLILGFTATTLINYLVSRASFIATELPLTSDNLYSEIQEKAVWWPSAGTCT